MITEKLTEILTGLFETIGDDFGLYVGLGLTLVVFLVGLIVSFVSGGELGKFKSCAGAALKDNSPANINANMQKMPIRVKKLYKRAMLTGAKPSDIINVDAAVNTPFAKSAMSKLPAITAVGAVVAICAGVGLSMVNSLLFGEAEGIVIALGGLLGGLLVLISQIISSLSYKGALKTYEELMDELDSLPRGGANAEQPHEEEHETGSYGYASEAAQPASEPAYEQAEPEQTYEQPAYEQPVYEQPTYEQPAYEQEEPESGPAQATVVVEEPSAEDIAAERARAREEAMAAARAEQAAAQAAAQKAQAEQTKSAAQQRLDELKAQREAQLKAQREAMAQQRAAQAAAQSAQEPSVSAEDVIERIDKIEQQGATLAEMREVAMLLQKERAKPENKSADQQKRLNEALSKLLKAMSSAQKK